MEAKDVFEKAVAELKNLNPGEKFIVKDLFVGYEWNRIDVKTRKQVGSFFFNMQDFDEVGIKALGKTSANQQRYEKL